MTGVFRTVLTNISGNTLTSTATINSVNLSDLERNISCRDSTGLSSRQVATIKLEGQHRSEQGGGGRLGGFSSIMIIEVARPLAEPLAQKVFDVNIRQLDVKIHQKFTLSFIAFI